MAARGRGRMQRGGALARLGLWSEGQCKCDEKKIASQESQEID